MTRFECISCYTALHTTKNQYYQYYLIYNISSAPHINLQELTLDTLLLFFWKLAQRAQTYTIHSSPALPSPGSLHLQSWACALLFGEARTLCMCGGMYWCQVSYHVVSWRGQSRGREAERVQLSRESGEMHEHQLLHWLPAGRRDASNWTQPLPEVQCLIFFITVIHTAFHSEPQ